MNKSFLLYGLMLLAAVAYLGACSGNGGDKQSKEERSVMALENEVILVHDKVMPRMADISSLRNKLKQIRKADSTESEIGARIDTMLERLDAADEAMMSWMHYYSDNLPDELKAKRAFLEQEKSKIESVRDQMLESIDNAEKILEYVETRN